MAKPKEPPADQELDADELEEGDQRGRTIPVEIKNLPPGVRAVLKLKPWREAKEFGAYIYQKVMDPQKPGRERKKFLKRVFNTEIEEAWLQQAFPRGGRFSVIYHVPHPDKPGDLQIHSDDFDVEGDTAAGALVAPGAAAAPAGAIVPVGDLQTGIMNLRALADVVAVLKGDQVAAPASPAWMEKMYQDRLKAVAELEEKLQRKLSGNLTVHQANGQEVKDPLAGWPDFVKPFVPMLKQWGMDTLQKFAGKLMAAGFEGMGVRAAVLNHPAFLDVWNNVEKRNAAVEALVQHLGPMGEDLVRAIAAEMTQRQGGQP